jgi:MYXO-CTERM domain-containing protein
MSVMIVPGALLRPGLPVLAAMLLTPLQAHALTTPASGAAARPAGLTLASPFPCNVTYKVIAGYGGAYHKNINEPLKANDYHALDLVRDEAGNGFDKPVTALAAGTVIYAGWAKDGWSTYGQIVVIELDFKDASTWQLNYAHLNQVSVTKGQHVKARDTIGTLGASGNNSLSYWSTKHVHLVLYRGAKIGSGGPYGGVAAVPEPMDGAQDFVNGKKVTVSCSPANPDGGVPDGTADGASAKDLGPGPDVVAGDGFGGDLPSVLADQGQPPAPPDDGCSCALREPPAGRPPTSRALLLVLVMALLVLAGRRRC